MPFHPPTAAWMLALAGASPRYSQRPAMGPNDLWSPLPIQHVDVNLDDGRVVDIAYIDSGPPPEGDPAAPPLVLIHGLSSSISYWEYQIGPLAQQHRVIALDLPGYGASGRPDAPYTPPWYAGAVRSWLDQIGVDKAVLVGHSMGGQISMTFGLLWPERVSHLVLSAPAGFETFSPGAAHWMKTYWHELRATEATEQELRATFTTLVFNKPGPGVERLLEERVRMSKTPAFRATSVAVSRSVAGMLDHPVFSRLGQLYMPTLVVYGTDDRMIPNPAFTGGRSRAIAQRGVDALPDARLVMIPGAGHTVHHDAPEAFNQAVLSFLRQPTR
jgi:pimeloyl-ACP methyl ester carboxylesterase